jgi:hypothetical protein
MHDEVPDLDDPFDWSIPQPGDDDPLVLVDGDVPFDPFTPSATS